MIARKLCLVFIFASAAALGFDGPKNPLEFDLLYENDRHQRKDITEYCYMDTAYLATKSDNQITSITNIWNFEQNRPFKCEEYRLLKKQKQEEYSQKIDEYQKQFPPKKIGPRYNKHR